MKKFNTLCALVILLVVTACSSVRFAYNHGETLLYWWLNGYIDFDAEQTGWVKRDIDSLFTWHRKTQLRDYADILRTAQRQLAGNVTQRDLLSDWALIKDRSELLLFKSLPELADLARSIKPDQLANLEKKFASNNADYRKKFMSGDEQKRKQVRYNKAMEDFELWFGGFSREQEAAIRRLSDARPLDNEIWLDERMRRQRQIVDLIRKVQTEHPSKEATMALIHGVIRDTFDRFNAPDRKAFFDAYTDSTSRFILAVIQMTTPAQKAHAQKRMQGWIDDFNQLAAEGH